MVKFVKFLSAFNPGHKCSWPGVFNSHLKRKLVWKRAAPQSGFLCYLFIYLFLGWGWGCYYDLEESVIMTSFPLIKSHTLGYAEEVGEASPSVPD